LVPRPKERAYENSLIHDERTGGWKKKRKLRISQLHNLYSSTNPIKVIRGYSSTNGSNKNCIMIFVPTFIFINPDRFSFKDNKISSEGNTSPYM
jgi:hypothetical protein